MKKFLNFKFITIIVLILGAVGFLAWKSIKNKPKDLTETAQKLLTKLRVSSGLQVRLNTLALNVAVNLGTAYPKWDPRYWYELDSKVFELLKNISRSEFDVISKLYFEVYAKGRTLSTDLAKLLDDKYYSQLKVK